MNKGARMRRSTDGKGRTIPVYPSILRGTRKQCDSGMSHSPEAPPIPGVLAPGMRVHMIGVGGCGMRGAAAILLRRGVVVSGSDSQASIELEHLAAQGARVAVGPEVGTLPDRCDLVVHSAAVKADHPEVTEARRRGWPVVKYAELLGLLMADRAGIAVAGTHGKSTTTAMTAYVLRRAGLDPSFVIGANVSQLGGGSGVGDGDFFVVEACEYDRSFLNLDPEVACILNIEEDHLDYYRDLDEIVEAFSRFAARLRPEGLLVVNGENRHAVRAAAAAPCRVETFGFEKGAYWQAEVLSEQRGCAAFRVRRGGRAMTDIRLRIPGRHNVSNALAVAAMCLRAGVAPEVIAEALGEFRGAQRRLTWHGCVGGVNVVDDYAHHPTELQVTIKAAREYYRPGKLYVVFQPHQHSRTRFLLNDFARSFGSADVVVVPDIYFVRDSAAERDLVDARDLVGRIRDHGGEAYYEPDFDAIVAFLENRLQSGDLVITMGAGDVWRIAERLLESLGRRG